MRREGLMEILLVLAISLLVVGTAFATPTTPSELSVES